MSQTHHSSLRNSAPPVHVWLSLCTEKLFSLRPPCSCTLKELRNPPPVLSVGTLENPRLCIGDALQQIEGVQAQGFKALRV